MQGCRVPREGLLALVIMSQVFGMGQSGKAFLDKPREGAPTPTAADDSDVLGNVEIAFALIGVGTIMLVGLLWYCCNKARRCDRGQQSRDRERSVSVIHITNNNTSNCVILERPPSYHDAMTTPECPPPPYPGFGLENVEMCRFQTCHRTPPPAYHNMAFNAGTGSAGVSLDAGTDDVMTTPVSVRHIFGGPRSSNIRQEDNIEGDDIQGETRISPDQDEGTENEGFMESDDNNNRESNRTSAISTSSQVPLLRTRHDEAPRELRVIIQPRDELVSPHGDGLGESTSDDETDPMVVRGGEVSMTDEAYMNSANSEAEESA